MGKIPAGAARKAAKKERKAAEKAAAAAAAGASAMQPGRKRPKREEGSDDEEPAKHRKEFKAPRSDRSSSRWTNNDGNNADPDEPTAGLQQPKKKERSQNQETGRNSVFPPLEAFVPPAVFPSSSAPVEDDGLVHEVFVK